MTEFDPERSSAIAEKADAAGLSTLHRIYVPRPCLGPLVMLGSKFAKPRGMHVMRRRSKIHAIDSPGHARDFGHFAAVVLAELRLHCDIEFTVHRHDK